jgi:hypothetical protein
MEEHTLQNIKSFSFIFSQGKNLDDQATPFHNTGLYIHGVRI